MEKYSQKLVAQGRDLARQLLPRPPVTLETFHCVNFAFSLRKKLTDDLS